MTICLVPLVIAVLAAENPDPSREDFRAAMRLARCRDAARVARLDSSASCLALAQRLDARGETQEALRFAELAVALGPNSEQAGIGVWSLLNKRGREQDALQCILKLADECGVKAIPLITQPWTTEALSDYNYSIFRLNVAVAGYFTQLVSFLSKLEKGEIQTLIVEDISVTRVAEPSGNESSPEGTIPVNASLDLAVYTQSPTIE